MPYTCALGETVTLDFDLTGFEHTCGFRFDPLLEDSSMVKLEGLGLTYEDDETRQVEMERIKTNSDVDFDPIFVYLHNDPKFFVDEALCLKLKSAKLPSVYWSWAMTRRNTGRRSRSTVFPRRRRRSFWANWISP